MAKRIYCDSVQLFLVDFFEKKPSKRRNIVITRRCPFYVHFKMADRLIEFLHYATFYFSRIIKRQALKLSAVFNYWWTSTVRPNLYQDLIFSLLA